MDKKWCCLHAERNVSEKNGMVLYAGQNYCVKKKVITWFC